MRITLVDVTTTIGRGLRAALGLGCLSVSTARLRALTSAPATTGTGVTPATPAMPVLSAPFGALNDGTDQGTRPPRALAALH